MREDPGSTEVLLLFNIVKKSLTSAGLARESAKLIVEMSSNIFLNVV